MRWKYHSKAKLLFTSTDSPIYEIDMNAVYGNFSGENDMFYFSKYSESSKLYDKMSKQRMLK